MTEVIIKQHCRNRDVFHTGWCRNAKLISETRKVDKALAKRMDLRKCQYCKSKREPAQDTECNRCGKTFHTEFGVDYEFCEDCNEHRERVQHQ